MKKSCVEKFFGNPFLTKLHFSIFHIFFSHQHVQMITGPHEKKLCGKILWGPLLNKIDFFEKLGADEDINSEL